MIWNSVRYNQKRYHLKNGGSVTAMNKITTWWVFFVPVYRQTEVMHWNS